MMICIADRIASFICSCSPLIMARNLDILMFPLIYFYLYCCSYLFSIINFYIIIMGKTMEKLFLINADHIKSESVASDSFGELEISGHDGDSLGVDGAQVGVLEQGDEVSFSGFLEGQHS